MSDDLGSVGNIGIGIEADFAPLISALAECTKAIQNSTGVMLASLDRVGVASDKASNRVSKSSKEISGDFDKCMQDIVNAGLAGGNTVEQLSKSVELGADHLNIFSNAAKSAGTSIRVVTKAAGTFISTDKSMIDSGNKVIDSFKLKGVTAEQFVAKINKLKNDNKAYKQTAHELGIPVAQLRKEIREREKIEQDKLKADIKSGKLSQQISDDNLKNKLKSDKEYYKANPLKKTSEVGYKPKFDAYMPDTDSSKSNEYKKNLGLATSYFSQMEKLSIANAKKLSLDSKNSSDKLLANFEKDKIVQQRLRDAEYKNVQNATQKHLKSIMKLNADNSTAKIVEKIKAGKAEQKTQQLLDNMFIKTFQSRSKEAKQLQLKQTQAINKAIEDEGLKSLAYKKKQAQKDFDDVERGIKENNKRLLKEKLKQASQEQKLLEAENKKIALNMRAAAESIKASGQAEHLTIDQIVKSLEKLKKTNDAMRSASNQSGISQSDINRVIRPVPQDVRQSFKLLDDVWKGLKMTIGGMFAYNITNWLQTSASQSLEFAGNIEKLNVQFKTLTGSAALSAQLFAQIQDYAVESPFRIPELADGAKKLLAVGFASTAVVGKLKILGDVAMGDGDKFNRLTNAFERVASRGKASLRELNMFIYAGVPIIQELAKNMGVAESKIYSMVTKGQVGFSDVDKALKTLTEDGGRFHNMMINQATTLPGLISILQDSIDVTFANITTLFLPAIKKVIEGTIHIVQNTYKATKAVADWSTKNTELIGTLIKVAAQLAIIGTAMYMLYASTIPMLIQSFINLGRQIVFVGQFIVLACQTHPVIALLTAVGALAASVALWHTNTKNAVQQINEINAKTRTQTEKTGDLIAAINSLCAAKIKDASTTATIKLLMSQLIDMYPKYAKRLQDELLLKGKITEATKKQIASEIVLAQTKDLVKQSINLDKEIAQKKQQIANNKKPKNIYLGPGGGMASIQANDFSKENNQLNDLIMSKANIQLKIKNTEESVNATLDMFGKANPVTPSKLGDSSGTGNTKKPPKDVSADSFENKVISIDDARAQKHLEIMDGLKESEYGAEREDEIRKELISKGISEYSEYFAEILKLQLESDVKKDKLKNESNERSIKAIKDIEDAADSKLDSLKLSKAKNVASVRGQIESEKTVAINNFKLQSSLNLAAELATVDSNYLKAKSLAEKKQIKETQETRRKAAEEEYISLTDNQDDLHEEELNNALAMGDISQNKFDKEMLLLQRKKMMDKISNTSHRLGEIEKEEPTSYKTNKEYIEKTEELARLNRQAGLENIQATNKVNQINSQNYRDFFEGVKSGFADSIGSMISGQQTLAQGFTSIFQTIQKSFGDMITNMVKEWITGHVTMASIKAFFTGTTVAANSAVVASNGVVAISNTGVATTNAAVATSAGTAAVAHTTMAGAATVSAGASAASSAVNVGFAASLIPTIKAVGDLASSMGKLAVSSVTVAIAFPTIALSSLLMSMTLPIASLSLAMMAGSMSAITPLATLFVPAIVAMSAGLGLLCPIVTLAGNAMTKLAISMAAASVAWIPVVGAVLGPMAAVATGTAIGMAGKLASFDVGAENIPQDMIAKVHQGERILTNQENSKFTNFINQTTKPAQPAEPPIHVNISAMDAQSFLDKIDSVTDRISKNLNKRARFAY